MKFQQGDKIKVKFGEPFHHCSCKMIQRYKHGIFSHYSKNMRYGFFIHTKSGKLLKRKSEEFIPVEWKTEWRQA